MIRLDVQEYCSECRDFVAEVEEPIRMFAGDEVVIQTDTVVRCEHRRRCEAIRRYLEKQGKEEK